MFWLLVVVISIVVEIDAAAVVVIVVVSVVVVGIDEVVVVEEVVVVIILSSIHGHEYTSSRYASQHCSMQLMLGGHFCIQLCCSSRARATQCL